MAQALQHAVQVSVVSAALALAGVGVPPVPRARVRTLAVVEEALVPQPRLLAHEALAVAAGACLVRRLLRRAHPSHALRVVMESGGSGGELVCARIALAFWRV